MKGKIKILIIADSDPRKGITGGIGAYSKNLAKYLLSKGIEVMFVGKKIKGEMVENINGINFIELNRRANQSNLLFYFNLKRLARSIRLNPDVIIHAQRPDWLIPFRKFNNKKIVTLHGSHSKNVYLKKGSIAGKIYDFMEKKGLLLADSIISVSDKNTDFYSDKYKDIKEIYQKITNIPIGIDNEKFISYPKDKARIKLGFNSNEKIIIFVGRLSKEKNISMLIKACKESNSKLLVVGEGKEERELRIYAEKIVADVIFYGHKDSKDISELMACSDALGLTSLYEGLPTVILEALAAGLPIIATDVGDVKEVVVDRKTGFVVDKEDIAEKIRELLKNTKKYKENCIKMARRYSWEKIGKRIVEEYCK